MKPPRTDCEIFYEVNVQMKLSPANLVREINELIGYLMEKGICDDQNDTFQKPISKNKFEITFSGSNNLSAIFDNINYSQIHQELKKNRSYNMKLIDGALIQLMYIIENQELIKHRLAFYPSPELLAFQNSADAYIQDELYVDIVGRRIIPFPLRFDFDPNNHTDIIHPQSHLTLGDAKNCRIPLSAPVTPYWFIEFILRNFYQTEKYDFISKLPKQKVAFPMTITNNEKKIIHMVIP